MIYEFNEKKFYYKTIGQGPAVLMIHGRGCDYRLMTGAFEPLFENRNYKRYYIDLPGMGQSDHPDGLYSSDNILEIVYGFINDVLLKENQSFLLIGQSYGGYLARAILADYYKNVDGVLLLCPAVKPLKDDRELPKQIIRDIDNEFVKTIPEEDKENLLTMAVRVNKEVYQRYIEDIKPGLDILDRTKMKELIDNYALSYDVDEKLSKIMYDKPISFITAIYDTSVGYKDAKNIVKYFPKSSFSVVDNAGHYLHIEQTMVFEALVEEWLERI